MSTSESGTPQITAQEAAERIEAGAFLLDVREDDEWAAGHAPAATHLPLGRIEAEQASLPKDQPIVAVCRAGGRSERAATFLRQAGYDVANLTGGMQAWAAAGESVVMDDGEVGTVI